MTLQKTNSVAQSVVKTVLLTEALLGLLAETRAGDWLQKWAFRAALRRTYTRFAETYPQWVAWLFDEYFVTCRLTPLLEERYLKQRTLPEAVELAKAWDKALSFANLEVRRRRIEELTPVAREFIRWLTAELQEGI